MGARSNIYEEERARLIMRELDRSIEMKAHRFSGYAATVWHLSTWVAR